MNKKITVCFAERADSVLRAEEKNYRLRMGKITESQDIVQYGKEEHVSGVCLPLKDNSYGQ